MDKTVKRTKLNKDTPKDKKKEQLLAKEEPAKKDQLPKDLKPLLAKPDHEVPKHVNDAINEKAQQLQPLIDAQKKIPSGLLQQNKTSEHPRVSEDLVKKHLSNDTTSTQVKTNNLNLGDNANKILNQPNATHNATALPSQSEVKPIKLANPNEEQIFQNKNPFADFSTFETNIEKMQPIVPDQATKSITQKLEERLKNLKSKKFQVGASITH